jgi:WD40 repeat protein
MRYANMTSVNGVSFSGDGSRVATCADDQGTVAAVWEVATGNRTATLSYSACKRAYPNRAVFSRSGDEALVATAEGAIVVWRISTGNVRILRGHLPSAGVSCVAASPVDDHAADVAQDGRAILWNLARGVMVVEFEGRVFGASDLAFSPDGRRLVAAGLFRLNGDQVMRGGNGTIVWDTTSGKKSLVLDAPSCSVAFSADGKLIATGWNDGTVALYDSKSGRLVRTVLGNNQ